VVSEGAEEALISDKLSDALHLALEQEPSPAAQRDPQRAPLANDQRGASTEARRGPGCAGCGVIGRTGCCAARSAGYAAG